MLPRFGIVVALPASFRVQTGSLNADFRGRWNGSDRSQTNTWGEFREWVAVSFRGWLFSSNDIQFDGVLHPGINQTREATGELSDSGKGYFLDGRLGFVFRPGQRLNGKLSLFSVRQDRTNPFGLQSDGTTFGANAVLNLENPYFPIEVTGRVRRYDRNSVTTAGSVRRLARDDSRVVLRARNSKTLVSLTAGRTVNRVAGTNSDMLRGDFRHRFVWGKGSRLTTAASASQMTGSSRPKRNAATWAQEVRLQHAVDVWSDYSYGLTSNKSSLSGSSNALHWAVQPSWRFKNNSIGSVRAIGRNRTTTTGFSEERLRVDGNVAFADSRVLGMEFRARAAGGYEWIDRTSSSDNGNVEVFDERHLVDDRLRFLLGNSNPDPLTVVVRDTDGLVVFELGLDYELVELGVLLEVIVLPGGRIGVGDVVRVDYQYDPGEDSEIDGPVAEYDLSLRSSRVTLYQRGNFRDFEVRGPVDTGGLERRMMLTTGANANLAVPIGTVSLGLGHRWSEAGGVRSNGFFASGTLAVQLGPRLTSSASARGDFVRGEEVQRDVAEAILRLDWKPLPALNLSGYASAWTWRQTGEKQDLVGSGVRVDWRVAKLNMYLRYDRRLRSNGGTNVNDNLTLGISRDL